MIIAVLLIIIISLISYFWASGIERMNTDYPDYKGDDFLDWDNLKDKS